MSCIIMLCHPWQCFTPVAYSHTPALNASKCEINDIPYMSLVRQYDVEMAEPHFDLLKMTLVMR